MAAVAPGKESGPVDSAPEDLMRLFAKAQRNLMDVNRSRLDALQELGAAHARIADLGVSFQLALDSCLTIQGRALLACKDSS